MIRMQTVQMNANTTWLEKHISSEVRDMTEKIHKLDVKAERSIGMASQAMKKATMLETITDQHSRDIAKLKQSVEQL